MKRQVQPHRGRLPIVGWREWVRLPELCDTRIVDSGIDGSKIEDYKIKAKVDTGARSSSLHAYDLESFEREGVEWVRFVVHPLQRDIDVTVACEAPLLERRWIRSSNGVRQHRPVIRTAVALADQSWPIDLTLTARDVMGFRMLLGREAVRRRFLVDPGRSYQQSRRPPRRR